MSNLTFRTKPCDVPKVETPFRRIVTPLPVPDSLPVLEMIRTYEPRSTQGQPPVVWDHAAGFQVHDKYGNMWLDWSSGVLVANIGHGHPAIRGAVRAEIDRGLLFSYCFPTEVRAKLAAKLVEIAPSGLDKVFLLNTGSEATENAIKLAKTFAMHKKETDRRVIVSFERGFHGRTLGAQLAGGSHAAKEWIGCRCPNFVQVPFPDGFRTRETSFSTFTAGLDAQGITGRQVAGVMMESYQGGGASFAPKDYVRELRNWCAENGALLVFDEVQSGFGRTGRLFAFEHYGVVPDIICCGKGISSSLPLSAVLGRGDVMDLFEPGSMTSTHGGHSLCCAAALANLEQMEEDNLVKRAEQVGKLLMAGLETVAQKHHSVVAALHGRGLVYGLHIVKPKSDDTPNPELAFDVVRMCFESGLLMFAPVGYGGATIKICPPLNISEDAIEDGLSVLAASFERAVCDQ